MKPIQARSGRRGFLKTGIAMASGITGISLLPAGSFSAPLSPTPFTADDMNIIGPKEGYSPQIGTLVSMMTWMRTVMLASVKGMNREQLDFLLDDKANTIGAMLYHLAATDTFYHLHTFQGIKWGGWDESYTKKWGVPMGLGEPARKEIKGHDLDFYLDILKESREKTLAEFKKRDDKWLMTVDKDWPWGPTNNYCKWFHVCEHESNHNGQIKFLKSRVPGAKSGND
ncbi:MAG: DUF664 domain-containing protein [Bacteroidetes bacterium]|nr:DUF664 domain-containing protein [Bacteroidota bacterium]